MLMLRKKLCAPVEQNSIYLASLVYIYEAFDIYVIGAAYSFHWLGVSSSLDWRNVLGRRSASSPRCHPKAAAWLLRVRVGARGR